MGDSMNPAFTVAREIGNNLGNASRARQDSNAIESILTDAMNTGDPEVLQNSIGKILSQVSPERQGMAIQYLQNKYSAVQAKQQEAKKRQGIINAGLNPDLPESLQKVQYENNLSNQQAQGIFGGQPSGQANALPQSVIPQQAPNMNQGALQQEPSPQGIQYKDLSDEQLVQLRGVKGFEKQADSELKRRQEFAKKKQPGDEFANIREKSVSDYVNNAIAQREQAEDFKYSIATARKAVQGNVAGPGLQAIAKNNPYTQLLVGLTPDEASLQAANKKLLEGSKGIFGSKPTEREIFLLLNSMLPSIGKTKEANLAGLDFIEKINDMKLLHAEMVDRLTDGGTKYVPDLERQVSALVKPFADKLRTDLEEAVEKYGSDQTGNKSKNGIIKVKAPDGTKWEMTQEQIDAARSQGVYFEPIK